MWLHKPEFIEASPGGLVTNQPHCSPHIIHFQTEATRHWEPELIESAKDTAKDVKIPDAVETVTC